MALSLCVCVCGGGGGCNRMLLTTTRDVKILQIESGRIILKFEGDHD